MSKDPGKPEIALVWDALVGALVETFTADTKPRVRPEPVKDTRTWPGLHPEPFAATDFGWWQFWPSEGAGRMDHLVTGESLVSRARLEGQELEQAQAAYPGEALRWRCVDYKHSGLEMSLVIAMSEDAGRIIVDYNLSAQLFGPQPAYGAWARVDDAVLEAFRIWPTGRAHDDEPGRLVTHGGWFNGGWERGLCREATCFPTEAYAAARFVQFRSPEPQPLLLPLDQKPWTWALAPHGSLGNGQEMSSGGFSWDDQVRSAGKLLVGTGDAARTYWHASCSLADNPDVEQIDLKLSSSAGIWLFHDSDVESGHSLKGRSPGIDFHGPVPSPQDSRRSWRDFVAVGLLAPIDTQRPASPHRVLTISDGLWIGDWAVYSCVLKNEIRRWLDPGLTFGEAYALPLRVWIERLP